MECRVPPDDRPLVTVWLLNRCRFGDALQCLTEYNGPSTLLDSKQAMALC